MFFTCKVCAEKDKRIASLEEQIAFLRNLAHPQVDNKTIPDHNHEANGVLDALDRPIEIETHKEVVDNLTEEERRERDALLDGSY